MTEGISATVNGEPRELQHGTTLAQLLQALDAPPVGIAIAKNDCVVRRSAFASETIEEGDRIEIIRAVAGG